MLGTRRTGTRLCGRTQGRGGAFAAALLVAGAFAPGTAGAVDLTQALAGSWELANPKAARTCRLTLGTDAAPGGHVVGAPPACRLAVPLLVQVSAWSVSEDKTLSLVDSNGHSVLDFKAAGQPGHFSAKAGADSFTLAPAVGPKDADRTGSIAAALSGKAPPAGTRVAAGATPAAAAAPADLPPLRPEAIVGLYGVAREKMKPICSIDLTSKPVRKAGTFTANLSGGCIDSGLKVFDPIAWRTEKGRLFLIARKGHEQGFVAGADGVFAKDPPSGAQLFLKKQ